MNRFFSRNKESCIGLLGGLCRLPSQSSNSLRNPRICGIRLVVLNSWLIGEAIKKEEKNEAMKGGRKNLKRGTQELNLSLQDGQSIMQVLSLRGSNLIEVMDAQGEKLLALFPAKFQKSMWIKRGSFVVVDGSGKEKALESGSKVACIVSQVLFYEQVRALQKSPEWPEIFRSSSLDDSNGSANEEPSHERNKEDESEPSEDDRLPPLEANLNRVKPFSAHSDEESRSGSDSDS